jgi:hypothetical protein
MGRPSFQFYPNDWLSNSNLRRCNHEEKGIWIDVICLLHDQDEYGIVRWPLKEIAQSVGCSLAKLKSLVSKGVLKGCDAGSLSESLTYTPRSGRKNGPTVELIPEQNGPIWYSSRMVIDEHKSKARGDHNDAPKGGIGEGIDAHQTPHPSRAAPSSSSSTSFTTSNTTATTKTKTAPTAQRTNNFCPTEYLITLGVNAGVVKDWVEHRKAKRSLPSETAIKRIMTEANKAGITLETALETCCSRGWIGFNADWVKDNAPAAGNKNGNLSYGDGITAAANAIFNFGKNKNEHIIDINSPPDSLGLPNF